MKTKFYTLHHLVTLNLLILLLLLSVSWQTKAQGWLTITEEESGLCETYFDNNAIEQTADGGYLTVNLFRELGVNKIRLYKLDQDGEELWTKVIQSAHSIYIGDITASPDSTFVIVGAMELPGSTVGYCLKIENNGNFVWEKLIPVVGKSLYFNDITISNDNEYILAGFTRDSLNYALHSQVQKLDINGNTQWASTYLTHEGIGNAVAQGHDNSIVVACAKAQSNGRYGLLLKYTATGVLEWDITNTFDKLEFIGVIPIDGDYYVAASAPYETVSRISKIDLNGINIWSRQLIPTVKLSGIRLFNDGIFAYGRRNASPWAAKLDTINAAYIWIKTLNNSDEFNSGVVTNNGELVCSSLRDASQPTQVFNGGNYSMTFNYYCPGYSCSFDCVSLEVIPNLPESPPYTYLWSDGGTSQYLNEKPENQTYYLTVTSTAGNEYTAQLTTLPRVSREFQICKIGENGTIFNNRIIGNVYNDSSLNCTFDNGETPLNNWTINVSGNNNNLTTLTDSYGNYSFELDSGVYEVSATLPNQLFEACNTAIPVTVTYHDTIAVELPMKPTLDCPSLNLSIKAGLSRRCMNSWYHFKYCNQGTKDATNSFIEVTFDTTQTVVSSSIPWSSQSGNTYTFQLGLIQQNNCGTLAVVVLNSCSLIRGQAMCTFAQIYPDSLCFPPESTWDGSITEVGAFCEQDSVRFEIKNTGLNPMSKTLDYFVVEDNVILKSGLFQLNPNETKLEKFIANGSTYRIYASQAPGYFPPDYHPTAAIEGCGVNSNGAFSIGFINDFPITDNTNFAVEHCHVVVGPTDPNDKSAMPEGVGIEHIINQNIDLDYLIRFQNVGTDTAFNVVIRDTLSEHLDITSLQQGASSHNYRLDIVGYNILKFTFPDIQLVDSLANEPASHGFVSFKISQQDSLPLGTMIYNSAAIYFDYEAPVITNQTYHEVGEYFIQISTPTETLEQQTAASVKVFPNPFNEYADIVLSHPSLAIKTISICDAMGRKILTAPLENNSYRIYKNQLPVGVYFFTISDQQQLVKSGKLIIN